MARRRWRTALKWVAVMAIWGMVALLGVVAYFAYDMPRTGDVVVAERRPALTVLAADGSAIARYGEMTGDAVHVDELPRHLIDAVVAIEDRRFYSHFGLDPFGIVRAVYRNIRAGRMSQGGSTITQQLAKNLFLTHERTLRRKVQEALLALWLEANYSKDEILTAYLNRVYLGAGTYGVDAAAQTYFGVSARQVNLWQAAILAGLLKAPSRYSPASNPDLAEARAETVLAAMVDAGFITAAQALEARELPPTPRRRPASGSDARYFADWVADLVPDYVGYGAADQEVVTTLVAPLQRSAQSIIADYLAGGEASQAALVAMRLDGAVVAMVGGVHYDDSQFNRAVQAQRQPGSAFKPIIYLAAIMQGMRPDTPLLDAPIRIGNWSPGNFSGRYRGEITATEALAVSANTAAVRVLQGAGVDAVTTLASRLGISTPLTTDMSLALGTSEVTLLDLTAAYGAFANGGIGVWPYAIEQIRDASGDVAYRRAGGGPGRIVAAEAVRDLTTMMMAVVSEGTGRAAALDRPAAGKTGTSQDFRDAWFVGFTADYVCGVWVGNDDGTPMDGITGGGLPARIWHDFMEVAHRGLPARPLLGMAPTPVAAADDGDAMESLLRRVLEEQR
ncbi:MAG: PBP1A family penicillin-binding protein [Rhodospirillaceae bacterium]|nr:PBP1A family penicillin-binding protein [Rhodospirillaceae bacterium]